MSAHAIEDQKAIRPETFVPQTVPGKAVVPAGARQRNTIATIEMRPDHFLDHAEEKQLAKPLDRVFAEGRRQSFFRSLPATRDPSTTSISPNCVPVKGPVIFMEPAFADCI